MGGRTAHFFVMGIVDSAVSSSGIGLNISKEVAVETLVRAIHEIVRELLLAGFIMN